MADRPTQSGSPSDPDTSSREKVTSSDDVANSAGSVKDSPLVSPNDGVADSTKNVMDSPLAPSPSEAEQSVTDSDHDSEFEDALEELLAAAEKHTQNYGNLPPDLADEMSPVSARLDSGLEEGVLSVPNEVPESEPGGGPTGAVEDIVRDVIENAMQRVNLEEGEDASQEKEGETESPMKEDQDNMEEEREPYEEEKKKDEKEEDGEESSEDERLVVDEELLKEREANLSDEQKQELKEAAQTLKAEGNRLFKENNFMGAVLSYSEALRTCPLSCAKERSIMYSNRAACKLHMDQKESAIEDCSKALELNPNYLKCLLRRAELYEKNDKLDEALGDYQKALEMDPGLHVAREACMRLPEQIKERNEKLKEEMMGKLKDLGNLVLRPFGLSTDNFKLNQDPNTGGYSVAFQQNQGQS